MDVPDSLIAWCLLNGASLPEGLGTVWTMGSGPLEENAFDRLLRGCGLQVFVPGGATDVLVIGRNEWSDSVLDAILTERSGLQLRVYSQEMFVAFLMTGVDPLLGDEEDVRRFADDHPALRYLEQVGFDWPSTIVPERQAPGTFNADMLSIGYLKWLGYEVGQKGRPGFERRRILRNAYAGVLPDELPADYVAQWGTPGSSARLQKMAESIAAFCRNAKKKSNPPLEAIAEWEADLAWLKTEFFDGRFRFHWPSTAVW